MNEDREDLGQVLLGESPGRVERPDLILDLALPGLKLAQESMPKVSPDGRYLAWIAGSTGSAQRLRVFDRATQDYVNEGVSLGSRPIDSWSLAQTETPLIEEFTTLPIRLSPGRYQITLRALRGSRVIELSKPRIVRVRRP